MKYSDIAPAKKLTVRRVTAVAMLECAEILLRMEKAGWVKPVLSLKQIDIFSVGQLETAVRRLEKEELPELNN